MPKIACIARHAPSRYEKEKYFEEWIKNKIIFINKSLKKTFLAF